MNQVFETYSAQETFDLGKTFGSIAQAGEIYCLMGDLGTGKTVFTQGFAEGLGVEEAVVSPTFTILQEYEGGRLPLYHFDVYRIEEPDEMDEIGFDEYLYGRGVCLIEWADLIEDLIPPFAKTVRIEKDMEQDFDYRRITVALSN